MLSFRQRLKRDSGWTFIEATLAVVIMAIMVLGLTIVLLAFREHLDRSWAVRVMDQYANDVIEVLTHELRNAVDVSVRRDTRTTDRITIYQLDEWNPNLQHTTLWYADLRTGQIKAQHQPIELYYPPRLRRRGEKFEIVAFQLNPYGTGDSEGWEAVDRNMRSEKLVGALYQIELTLRYTRTAVNPGDRNWVFQKDYKNKVYLRNKNLIVKKGITQ